MNESTTARDAYQDALSTGTATPEVLAALGAAAHLEAGLPLPSDSEWAEFQAWVDAGSTQLEGVGQLAALLYRR